MKYPVIEVIGTCQSVLTSRNAKAPQKDEMVVKPLILPVDSRDYHMFCREDVEKPYIPGGGFIGTVEALGEQAGDLYGVASGDLVYVERNLICGKCKPCMTGHYSACEENRQYGTEKIPGAAAETVTVIKGSRVHKLEKDLDLDMLSLLPLAELALSAVLDKADGYMGKSLLITNLSLFTVLCAMIARQNGFSVVQLMDTQFDGKKYEYDLAKAVGVDIFKPAEKKKGFDVVIDNFSDGSSSTTAMEHILPLGKYVVAMQERDWLVPAERLCRNEVQIMGLNSASWSTEKALLFLKQNWDILKTSIIFERYGLSSWEKALQYGKETHWCKQIVIEF